MSCQNGHADCVRELLKADAEVDHPRAGVSMFFCSSLTFYHYMYDVSNVQCNVHLTLSSELFIHPLRSTELTRSYVVSSRRFSMVWLNNSVH